MLDRQTLFVEELAKGIHDERSLGDVGPQDRYRRVPALVLHLGVEDLNLDLVRLTLLQETPRAQGDVSEGLRTPPEKKFLGSPGEENFGERDHRLRLFRIDLPLELAAYGVDCRRLFTEAANHRAEGVAHGSGRSELFRFRTAIKCGMRTVLSYT